MKTAVTLTLILLLAACQKTVKSTQDKGTEIKDTVATKEIPSPKYGTIIKKSKPFKINGMECYWEQTDTLAEEGAMEVIKLKDYKTNRILMNHVECCLKYGFDFDSPDNFKDVNFDGFNDFLIVSYGSSAMFELTNIYLFDHKTKRFVYSDLSDNSIETDRINRKLTTHSSDTNFEKTKTHYFTKFGKLNYTEVVTITHSDTTAVEHRTYEKIVNGKVVQMRKGVVVKTEK
jgi:hypothetical protein